jgi:hypothetical protein
MVKSLSGLKEHCWDNSKAPQGNSGGQGGMCEGEYGTNQGEDEH